MKGSLFITGTDTGVGKTFVACLLAESLLARGLKVGALKPFISGGLDDVIFLKKSAQNPRVRTFLYCQKPLTPAAQLGLNKAGQRKVERVFQNTLEALAEEKKLNNVVLVEGVGGVMAPLGGPYVVADLMVRLGLPTWIVARAGLGTLNHTLLTVEALRRRGVEVRRIFLNQAGQGDLAEKSNPFLLRELTEIPVTVVPRANTRLREKKARALIGTAFQEDFSAL